MDIIPEKVELINQRKSPIQDEYIEKCVMAEPLTLYDYGNGMYKAFYIAVAALLAKDGILLVDEVETGIHNKALDKR